MHLLPSGPLHFGSLVAALGSYFQAKSQKGQWLVRMEDLDPPREMPGAADLILKTLETYQLHWDGEVIYQSHRHPAYQAQIDAVAYRAMASLLLPMYSQADKSPRWLITTVTVHAH